MRVFNSQNYSKFDQILFKVCIVCCAPGVKFAAYDCCVCSHKATQEAVSSMDVDPLTETTDFDALRDNRDCSVLVTWDAPHRYIRPVLDAYHDLTGRGCIVYFSR